VIGRKRGVGMAEEVEVDEIVMVAGKCSACVVVVGDTSSVEAGSERSDLVVMPPTTSTPTRTARTTATQRIALILRPVEVIELLRRSSTINSRLSVRRARLRLRLRL